MRILVFMSDNRPLQHDQTTAEYHSLAAAINAEYCRKHKYNFLYYRMYKETIDNMDLYNCNDPTTGEPRHASWSKLLATQHAMDLGYDYIVYIDTDCIFRDFNTSLETFIDQSPKHDILFFNNKPWHYNLPCAGFYISKVSPTMKTLFEIWYATSIPEYNKKHHWEQEALWMVYKEYDVGILDKWMFYEDPGQFLRHIGSSEKENRMPYFHTKIAELDIDYSKIIGDISSIDLNTIAV